VLVDPAKVKLRTPASSDCLLLAAGVNTVPANNQKAVIERPDLPL
jgi:hypothetical protein